MNFQDEPEEVEEGAPAWMATFADMATLLMTFFVLLLSFANMDITEFRTLMGSVRDAFGVQFAEPGDYEARANSPLWVSEGGSPSSPSILQNGATIQRVRQALHDRELDNVVQAEMDRRGVALRIRGAVLFESGSDALRPQGLTLLAELGELSSEFVDEVAVEGHTDNRPINTTRFPSNWELSAARATAVLRHLERSNPGELEMSIAGYSDTRPVADNESSDGRSRNRRVELILIRPPAADDEDGEGGGTATPAVAPRAMAAEDGALEEPASDEPASEESASDEPADAAPVDDAASDEAVPGEAAIDEPGEEGSPDP